MTKVGTSIPVPVLFMFGAGALLLYTGITTNDSPVQVLKDKLSSQKAKGSGVSGTIGADTISSINGTAPDLAGVNAPINGGVPAPLVAPAPSPAVSPGGSIPGTRYQ